MSRQSRAFWPGASIHVIQRGNNGLAVFKTDSDCDVFLALLRRASGDRAAVHGFVVMTTHFHLIVTAGSPETLARMMKELDQRYTRYFNRTYGRTGTLWNGRYRSFPIETEIYWLTCLLYIEQNPVRAGMVDSPEKYRWSSYPAHAFGKGPSWLTEHRVYQDLGKTSAQRQAAYRALCQPALPPEQVSLVRQGLLGVKPTSDTVATGVKPASDSSPTYVGVVSDITATRG